MAYIEQSQVSALIGRSLNQIETRNFNLYEEIAEMKLSDLLCRPLSEVAVEDKLPADLLLVLARLFGAIKEQNSVEHGVESKQVEDFRIQFKDSENSIMAETIADNGATILKYSMCGGIRHGRTIMTDRRYYHNDRV